MKCGETIPNCAICNSSFCDECKINFVLKNDKTQCLTDCSLDPCIIA